MILQLLNKALLLSLALCSLVSCSKFKETIIDGGCTYDGIYFETETGMIDAHEYKLNVPGAGGEYDFRLLGVEQFKDGSSAFGFVDAAKTESSARPDENKYYKANLHLTVHENMTDQKRSVEFRIYSLTCLHCAKITITQEKGF